MSHKLSFLLLLSLLSVTFCDPPRIRAAFKASEVRPYHLDNKLISNEETSLDLYLHNSEIGLHDWNIENWSYNDPEQVNPSKDNQNSLTGITSVNKAPEIQYGQVDNTSPVTRSSNEAYDAVRNANVQFNSQIRHHEIGSVDYTAEQGDHVYSTEDIALFVNNAHDFDIAEPMEPLPEDDYVNNVQSTKEPETLPVNTPTETPAVNTPVENTSNNFPVNNAPGNVPTDIPPINSPPEIHYGPIDNPEIVIRSADEAYDAIRNANNFNREATPKLPADSSVNSGDENLSIENTLQDPNTTPTINNESGTLPPVSTYPNIVTRTARASYDAVNAAKEVIKIENNNLASLYDDMKNPIQTAPALASSEAYSTYNKELTNDLNNLRGQGRP